MRSVLRFLMIILTIISGGCADVTGVDPTRAAPLPSIPGDFPAVTSPGGNPLTPEKARLGRYLFYDKRLSLDSSLSCASCHRQEEAFSDSPNRASSGFLGRTGSRNAMSLTNVAYNRSFFWDGGVATLEQQALAPIINPAEMNMNTDTLLARLRSIPAYIPLFRAAWGDATITLDRATGALASFERTLVSGSAPFDRWRRGDNGALDEPAIRGYRLFFGEKGDCFHCHASFNFTDNSFRDNGLGPSPGDEGRYALTGREDDRGKFRVPTLRNVAVTPPYMHDGRFGTLEEVLAHYNAGERRSPGQDPLIRPLGLSEQEQRDIIAFLRSLTDRTFLEAPSLGNPWQ